MGSFGDVLVENFMYQFEESEQPTFRNGQPTGETIVVKDLIFIDPEGGINYRVRFHEGEMYDTFCSKVALSKVKIAQDTKKLVLPAGLRSH
jgi:hypothetical protein